MSALGLLGGNPLLLSLVALKSKPKKNKRKSIQKKIPEITKTSDSNKKESENKAQIKNKIEKEIKIPEKDRKNINKMALADKTSRPKESKLEKAKINNKGVHLGMKTMKKSTRKNSSYKILEEKLKAITKTFQENIKSLKEISNLEFLEDTEKNHNYYKDIELQINSLERIVKRLTSIINSYQIEGYHKKHSTPSNNPRINANDIKEPMDDLSEDFDD